MKPLLRRLLLWFALPVLLVALAVWSWTPREPSWDGRSLTSWLEDLEIDQWEKLGAIGDQNAEAAIRAIRGMGTNSLPFVLRRIENLEQAPHLKMLMQLEGQLAKHDITFPWDRTRNQVLPKDRCLCYVFRALEHEAAPAVPALQRLLFSPEGPKTTLAAMSLAQITPEGIDVLIAASTNRHILEKHSIVTGLSNIAKKSPEALTAFIGMADNPDPYVRAYVGYLIADSQHEAGVIWPVVKRLLADPESFVRQRTVVGLCTFKGDLHPAEPALSALLTDPDPEISTRAEALLVKLKAQSSTPPPAP